MSLWRHRRAIARAVTGELDPPAEARLRAHLARCPACRRHYDACRAIAQLGQTAPAAAAAQERSRLLRAIQHPEQAPAPARARTAAGSRSAVAWAQGLAPWALLPVAAGASLLLVLARRPAIEPPSSEEPEVVMRGPAPGPSEIVADDLAAREREQEQEQERLALRFYGRARATPGEPPAPVRLVGVLPGSGELRAGRDEELQIAYVGLREPQHLALLALDERGAVHRLYPPDGRDQPPAPLPPAREPRLLEARLGVGDPRGRLQIFGLVTRDARAIAQFERGLREHAGDPRRKPPAASFKGTLWIER